MYQLNFRVVGASHIILICSAQCHDQGHNVFPKASQPLNISGLARPIVEVGALTLV